MVRRSSEYRLIKSSVNLLIIPQKIFLRSHEDLRKIFIEDLLKISKRTLNEIFLISRARQFFVVDSKKIFRRFKEDIYVRSHGIWVLGCRQINAKIK